MFHALPSDHGLGSQNGCRTVITSRRHRGSLGWRRGLAGGRRPWCVSRTRPLACSVPGASRQAQPLPVARAGCRSSRPSDQKLVGLQPSGDSGHAIQCSAASQTRFRWSDGMMSCLLCPGVACWNKEAGGPAGRLPQSSPIKVCFPHDILDSDFCAKQCVSKSSRALDAVLRAVRWRRAKNRLGQNRSMFSEHKENSD